MKKKIRRRITNSEPRNQRSQRRLELARETVRVLGANDLSDAAGGSWTGCDTGSWPTWTTKAPQQG
jgi:hypothetical protein